ncbi:LytTR family two component transcriptional regulator [Mucilaginibacter frigoritolerans]|jgi:DNA-binding LytR/AlgR family response regulator|uniref:LytTR family two component transcriptional regulator n=1 Tax=Mucilaginibacter frigoritolerans TaxID=652788 RepID=A0A562TQT9_9SPHI|nr:LytTR family DNA-binding domain-containing protein [Mucilaginibacter frigoritolerans]TWI95971.1 LytTR family two component transcriptional regulator [Mucilaginibacter frigoritolerans]
MKCIAIDDEPFALDLITGYIKKTPFLEFVEGFTNPFKAMAFLAEVPVDLVFLDINMPELSGIEFLNSLTVVPKIIFTTAHAEYGAESYEFNAVDYLLKPVKYDRFLKAVNKAKNYQLLKKDGETIHNPSLQDNKSVLIKSGSQLFRIAHNDIFYIEGCGNYITIYTKNGKIMPLLPLNDIVKMLPADMFIRIHKSYIVSLKHIEVIDKAKVIINKTPLPIGITYREHFARIIKGEVNRQ